MNTRLLMIISAFIMAIIGIVLSFFPQEVSPYLNLAEGNSIILQILGALYFGFAILNWTAKANLIRGIYSRPVALGNFAHFFIGGLALIKLVLNNHLFFSYILLGALVYLILALFFGYILFTNPVLKKKNI